MNYIHSHYSTFLCLHSPFQDLYGYATIVFFSDASKPSNVRSRKSGRRWRHDVHKRASKESLNTENVYRLSNHVSADFLHPLQLNFNSYVFLLRLKNYTSRRSSGERLGKSSYHDPLFVWTQRPMSWRSWWYPIYCELQSNQVLTGEEIVFVFKFKYPKWNQNA